MRPNRMLWMAALSLVLPMVAPPVLAGFLSPDTEPADHENFNRYWYANNNPYTYVDPDGRCAKVTGSNVCGSTVAVAAMAKTALVPQTFTADMVSHVGPARGASVQRKETERLVNDANKAGQVAQLSGDSRAISAMNRISSTQIDSSDWAKGTYRGTVMADPRSIAFAEYDTGTLTFNAFRYFSRQDPYRVGIILHEALHLDSGYQQSRLLEFNRNPPCVSLGCQFERDVESHKNQLMDFYSE